MMVLSNFREFIQAAMAAIVILGFLVSQLGYVWPLHSI
uniref:Uncharacterized protein n=1 Tax=Setaria italica TaxID=4555 RepID=K3ZGM4_SETIT